MQHIMNCINENASGQHKRTPISRFLQSRARVLPTGHAALSPVVIFERPKTLLAMHPLLSPCCMLSVELHAEVGRSARSAADVPCRPAIGPCSKSPGWDSSLAATAQRMVLQRQLSRRPYGRAPRCACCSVPAPSALLAVDDDNDGAAADHRMVSHAR
ncbi:hypothetical protein PHYPSEUDO_012596 [Phytophthora pseudosyringae]|uniref:Uncharacterized protein n=1 Tax=Phytophthora pseudosyringae TaxID=221518 RepID=A0A8T1W6R2_9STRA|nr:hypothetical protein PHYPSEUDO_012596 [Phytophthora pseudosyringae]